MDLRERAVAAVWRDGAASDPDLLAVPRMRSPQGGRERIAAYCATDPVARQPLGNPYRRFGSGEEREGSIELISVPFPTRLHLP